MKRKQGQRPLLPNYQAVVFDEAHKLLEAARQIYGFALSERDFEKLTEAAGLLEENKYVTANKYMAEFCRSLETESSRFFEGLERKAKAEQQDETERFSVSLTAVQKSHIRRIAEYLEQALTIVSNKRLYINQDSLRFYITQSINKLLNRLESLSESHDLVLWLELPKIESGSIILNAIPKQLDKILYEDFWRKRIPSVLTSGTISAAGSFTHYKKSLGLHRTFQNHITELSHASPLQDEEFRNEYESLQPDFAILQALIETRSRKGITQKELADRTGIAQSDICKIERGVANPSLRTLKRLARGMDKTLRIEFVDEMRTV